MELLNAGVVRTRRNYVCYGCGHDFPRGSMLYRERHVWNRQFFSTSLCQDCYDVSREWGNDDWEGSTQGEMGYWKNDSWHPVIELAENTTPPTTAD